MKKTLRVNISGTIFNIDEDAYYQLKKYLDVLEIRFGNSNEGKEIFSDIESRIAEHLSDKINANKTVIIQSDIDEIIATMGNPEDFDTDAEHHEDSFRDEHTSKKNRRMYRDPDEKYIAGVASGVSQYFGIDPLIIRALFIISLFFAGTGLFIYLILWIALPEANTPSQKLEMSGRPITISNIESSLNEEFRNVKANFEKLRDSGKYDDLKNSTNRIVKAIGSVIFTLFKIALILFGVVLVISAISAIFGLTGGLFFADTIISLSSEGVNTLDHWALIELIDDTSKMYFIYIGIILTAVLPLIIVLFFGLKLIFKFRSNNKVILLSAFGLWFAGVLTLAASGFSLSANFKQKAEITEKKEITFPKGKILVIDLNPYQEKETDEVLIDLDEFGVIQNDSSRFVILEPKVEILPAIGNKIVITIYKQAKGKTKKEAYQNAKSISMDWVMEDSTLRINQFFHFLSKNKWRNQEVYIKIEVPTNEKVFIDKSLNQLNLSVKNTEYFWDIEVTGRSLVMTDEGLCIPNSPQNKNSTSDTLINNVKEVNDEMLNDLQKELNK